MKTPKISGLIERIPRAQRLWFLTAILLFLTAFIGFSAIYTPWQQNHQRLERDCTDEEERANLLQTITRQGKKLKQQEKTFLMGTGGTSALTGQVSHIASATGIHIESVIPQNEVPFGPYTKFQIQILATSSFQELVGFLQAIEKDQPILQIDQVSIENLLRESQEGAEAASADRQKAKLLISGFAKRGTSP